MTYDLTISDADQNRDYHLSVLARVRPEIGAPGTCVDLERVQIDKVVIWGGEGHKYGEELFPGDFAAEWERWVLETYGAEIREAVVRQWEERRWEENTNLEVR